MHWPPKHEDRAAWSAVGGVVTGAAVVLGVASVWWPVVAALAAMGICLMVAPLLQLGPWRQEEPQLLSPTGITAGHSIKAGGNIETDGRIEAGHGVEAGGNIQAGALDRVDLLREQYSQGRSLQRKLVWAGGIPDTPEKAREAEDQARHAACKWGQGAWRVIGDHFSGYEQEFFGDGHLALGATGFALACQHEIERLGSSADTYLEKKLEFIAELLRKYDS
jgi:hypothetical protein